MEVLPIFEASGVRDWPEFCVRFAASFPQIQGTIGASSKIERVKHMMRVAEERQPLPQATLDALMKCQRRWSEEVDMKAKPWTM